jgi:peptidoglycan-associated lipoprotein
VVVAILLAGLAGACKHPKPIANAPVNRTPVVSDPGPVNEPPCQAPSVSLVANAVSIERGQASTLTWRATNADSVRIEPEIGAAPLTGSRQVSPQSSVTYTATATSLKCGAQSGVARITVNEKRVEVVEPRRDEAPREETAKPAEPIRIVDVRPADPAPEIRPCAFGECMLSILFDYDKAELRPDQLTQLQADATWLKENPNVRVVVEGHADERGNQEYNLALGVRRANTVVQYLVSQGVNEARIRSISYGKERPACQDDTPDEGCHQKNRRAAFSQAR